MAKSKIKPINLISVWTWAYNEIDNNSDDYNKAEQLALFHIIGRLNRNEWQPTRIGIKRLAASMNSDKRTVEKAIDGLKKKNMIEETEGTFNVTFKGAGDNGGAKDNARDSEKNSGDVDRTDDGAEQDINTGTNSDELPGNTEIESAEEYNFKYFDGGKAPGRS